MIILFLKSLYHSEMPMVFPEKEYRKILKEIERSAIGAQVYSLLKSSGRLSNVPDFFREQLSRIYQGCFIQNLLIRQETELLIREFDRKGIAVIPLKGTVMAERFFGHFAARGTSDVDLLIKPEQMNAAIACVVNAGYSTPLKENPSHYHLEWIKIEPGLPEPLTVELHWSLAPMRTSRMRMEAAWETAEPLAGYANVKLMGATYTFYSLCVHGASHQMDSLKYVLDLCQLLHHHSEQIDMNWVWKQARSDGTKKRIMAALSIVYTLFPELHGVHKLPFQPKVRFWNLAFVSEPEQSKQSLRHALSRKLFVLAVMDSWRYRLSYLYQLILPSKKMTRYSLDTAGPPRSLPILYYRLYKQRLRKMFGGV